MLRTVVRLGVKHVEEHDGSESQGEVDDGEGQQSCEENIGRVMSLDNHMKLDSKVVQSGLCSTDTVHFM